MLKLVFVVSSLVMTISLVTGQTSSTYAIKSYYGSSDCTANQFTIQPDWVYYRVNACIYDVAVAGKVSLKGNITTENENSSIWTEHYYETITCAGPSTQASFPTGMCIHNTTSSSSLIQIAAILDPPGLVGLAGVLSFYGSCNAVRNNPIYRQVYNPGCSNTTSASGKVSSAKTLCNSTHIFTRSWSAVSDCSSGTFSETVLSPIGCNSTTLGVAECISFPTIVPISTSSTGGVTGNMTTLTSSTGGSATSTTSDAASVSYRSTALVLVCIILLHNLLKI